jgi:hypothetical protein
VLTIAGLVCAIAIPDLLASRERARTTAAARYLVQQCYAARTRAIGRSTVVALRFEERQGEYHLQMFADENRNGVRSADIAAGLDRPLGPAESLSMNFPNVRIALAPELGLGSDPVKAGAGNLLSFTPVGTATPGSIFVVGRDGTQFVVRVLGATARTRLQRFDRERRTWVDQW